MDLEFVRSLIEPAQTKIVLMVLDGLGGLPREVRGPTELEAANTPHLDELAAEGICGLHVPVGPGITPGSGPSHLGLFGYDPIEYQVGRGVLAAMGIGFDLQPDDVAARGNFCTVDDEGCVVDRRAGRIDSETNRRLCQVLRDIRLPNVDVFVQTVKEYRLLLVLRGPGLSGDVTDTDPQATGASPLEPQPRSPRAEKTAALVGQFLAEAKKRLADQHPANMVLLRGFAERPDWPRMEQVFGVRAAAIAAYPMYRGLARLIGMTALETGEDPEDEVATLERHWDAFDFFYLHIKKIDSAGEDGDFDRKVRLIEAADKLAPRVRRLDPDVLAVTGDHSTPSMLKSHGWQPVPVLLWSRHVRADPVEQFGERACMAGGLGATLPATHLMPLMLAEAERLKKFGA